MQYGRYPGYLCNSKYHIGSRGNKVTLGRYGQWALFVCRWAADRSAAVEVAVFVDLVSGKTRKGQKDKSIIIHIHPPSATLSSFLSTPHLNAHQSQTDLQPGQLTVTCDL